MIMEYQISINLWDNTPNQPSKLEAKNLVEQNDGTREAYNTNSQIKFKTSMLKSSLCDYSEHIYLLKELYLWEHKKEIIQIMTIKN